VPVFELRLVAYADLGIIQHRYCQGELRQPIFHDHVQPLALNPGYAAAPQTFSTEQPPLQSREDLPFHVKTNPRREFITLD
jgi:hypothetical protein